MINGFGDLMIEVFDLTFLLARAPGNWSYLELRAARYDALREADKARADRAAATATLPLVRRKPF